MTVVTPAEAVICARENAAYLRESLALFPDIETAFARHDPEYLLQAEYEGLPKDIGPHDAEMALLRILKRRVHLIIALADIAQIWDWVLVTRALTALSDICMKRLLIAGSRALEIDSGEADNPVPGLFILAMGKYGAGELNYSSDIDFCVFYDPEVIALPRPERAERTLIKFVQKLIAGFERITAEGYIFRTDLRLRPDPRSNAVAVSTLTAERYYETLGQNWERAAMIKARVCGGDQAVGEAFIQNVLRPFIWRRSLDYAAIEDIHSIKRQIQARQAEGALTAAGHHLKLGTGGIREIEFYAQTQQLILGGRNPDVRTPRTVQALEVLSQKGFIDPDDADALSLHYAALRKYEHAAQMREDAQTHHAPKDDKDRVQLARLSGFETLEGFDAVLIQTLNDVHRRYLALFPEFESLGLEEGSLSFTGVEPHPATLETLEALGFEDRAVIWSDMAKWLGGRISATRTERARELLTRLAPRLIKICANSDAPDAAFKAFGSFFERVNGGVSLLAMFLQEPDSLAKIIDLMLISPRLADTLSGRPAILDAMIAPDFMAVDIQALGQDYKNALNPDYDFEEAMNFVRRRLREDQFRISAAGLSGHMGAENCSDALSKLADETLDVMLPVAAAETARRTGSIKGDYAVIALGKAGGRELSLASDLDVMVIYDAPADSPTLFTKLTQRLVSAVSSVTAEGQLYELDMALRPSGRSGPVAVNLEAFVSYYKDSAWTWEFMALTRARVMAASSPQFSTRLSAIIASTLIVPRHDLNMPDDIANMLRRLRREKPPRGPWDIKLMQGGARDIEFIAQSLYLARRDDYAGQGLTSTQSMLQRAQALGQIPPAMTDRLLQAKTHYDQLTQFLTLSHGSLEGEVHPRVLAHIARLMDFPSAAALQDMTQAFANTVCQILAKFIALE